MPRQHARTIGEMRSAELRKQLGVARDSIKSAKQKGLGKYQVQVLQHMCNRITTELELREKK